MRKTVHCVHNFHCFHPICTGIAPEINLEGVFDLGRATKFWSLFLVESNGLKEHCKGAICGANLSLRPKIERIGRFRVSIVSIISTQVAPRLHQKLLKPLLGKTEIFYSFQKSDLGLNVLLQICK